MSTESQQDQGTTAGLGAVSRAGRWRCTALALGAVVVAGGLAACGGSSGTNSAGSGGKYTINFAGTNKPDTPTGVAADAFAKQVGDATKGSVKVKVFPNGQLGDPATVLQHLRSGSVQMAYISPGILSAVLPELDVLSLPFLFSDRDAVFAKLNGAPGTGLAGDLEKKAGLTVLAWEDFGFYQVINKVRRVKSPADLKGVKIIISPSPVNSKTFSSVGAQPVSIGHTEAFTALQSGLAQGHANPIASLYSGKDYQVANNLTMANVQYSAAAVVIKTSLFDSMPKATQDALRQTAQTTATKEVTDSEKNDAKVLQEMKTAGVHVDTLSPSAKAAWQQSVQSIYNDMEAKYGKPLVDSLRG